MTDPRMNEAICDITSAFCGRTFGSFMPLVLDVLNNMSKKHDVERETVCVSFGPLDLFKFLNEIIDLSLHCPCEEVIRSTLGLISKVLFNFQKEYRLLVVEAEDMEMPIYCSLTNSSMKFMANLKQFEERIVRLNLISEEAVLKILNHAIIVKNFAQTSMLAFGRIENMAKTMISHSFGRIKTLKTFDLQAFVLGCIEQFAPIFKMLLSNYSKRLWVVIFEHICKTYLLMVITLSTQYSPKEGKELAARLRTDKSMINELFAGQINVKELHEQHQSIEALENCLTKHIEEVVIYLVPLAAALGKDFNDNCIVV